MQTNFKITVEYDGSHFSGWQVQKRGVTVQGELERAISLILNQPIKVIGSGRTDAGVHAIGQAANFHARTDISPENLLKGLNSIIKTPIVIRSCHIVPSDFHARYSATSKEYHYHILNCEYPCAIGRDYLWQIKQPLDIETMDKCCSMMLGEHDFKSFEASGSPRSHTIRTIYKISIDSIDYIEQNDLLFPISPSVSAPFFSYPISKRVVFKIRGNGFLRFMVRNIVGTVVMAGLSRITVDDFKDIFKAKDRTLAGATAPAKGLVLMSVNYE